MKNLTQRSIALACLLILGTTSLALGAKRRNEHRFILEGQVLEIDQRDRTMLVSDRWSKKLYLVIVPKDASFRITFGLNMNVSSPELRQVRQSDRVMLVAIRTGEEHFSRLDDASRAAVAVVAK